MRDRMDTSDEAIDRVVGAWLTPPDDPLFVQRVLDRLPLNARLPLWKAWWWQTVTAASALALAVTAYLSSPPGDRARLTSAALTSIVPLAAPAPEPTGVVSRAAPARRTGSSTRAFGTREWPAGSDTEWGIAPMALPEPLVIDAVAVGAIDIEGMSIPALAIRDVSVSLLTIDEPED